MTSINLTYPLLFSKIVTLDWWILEFEVNNFIDFEKLGSFIREKMFVVYDNSNCIDWEYHQAINLEEAIIFNWSPFSLLDIALRPSL